VSEGYIDVPSDRVWYQAAILALYREHFCRPDPWPACVERSFAESGQAVYLTMNGPREFSVTGTPKDWEALDRLGEITVPTLLVGGRYDECRPSHLEEMHHRIPVSQLAIIEDASHLCFAERPEEFTAVVNVFFDKADQRATVRSTAAVPQLNRPHRPGSARTLAAGEDQAAIRAAGIFTPRLVHVGWPSRPARPWKPRGSVLVTAGAGRRGAQVAQWLARCGAGHVVVASSSGSAWICRSAPSTSSARQPPWRNSCWPNSRRRPTARRK
jgi:hypothetical protein